jgi:enoyl-CoA hydratase
MAYDNVILEKQGPIGVLTISRPKQLNALNSRTLMELYGAVGEASSAEEIRVLVITGAGDKAFVAGADIKEMSDLSVQEARAFSELGHRVCTALEEIQQPVIAAVNGFALGGGTELALACDFIYASNTARFGQPEVNLGVIPGFGGTQRLCRRVGVARGREIIYSGAMIRAAQAKEIGLVNEVFEPGALMDKVFEKAKEIAAKGPLAVAQAKRVIYQGYDLPLVSALELERQIFAGLFDSSDQKEGMAAFVEKRKPDFKGK